MSVLDRYEELDRADFKVRRDEEPNKKPPQIG
jgi:hypothetical protein